MERVGRGRESLCFRKYPCIMYVQNMDKKNRLFIRNWDSILRFTKKIYIFCFREMVGGDSKLEHLDPVEDDPQRRRPDIRNGDPQINRRLFWFYLNTAFQLGLTYWLINGLLKREKNYWILLLSCRRFSLSFFFRYNRCVRIARISYVP